jgi:carbamoyltransferase
MSRYVLGLNFGHDASLALFRDLELECFLELERVTRLKHTVGLCKADILKFLHSCNLRLEDVSCVAFTGTQWYNLKHSRDIFLREEQLSAELFHEITRVPRDISSAAEIRRGGTNSWYDFRDHASRLGDSGQICQTPTVLSVATKVPSSVKNYTREDVLKSAFKPKQNLIPYSIKINDVVIPAFFVMHHVAHAYYAYHYADSDSALIVSHDGGWPHIPLNSGGFFLAHDEELICVSDPRLYLGQIYQIAGELAGFGPAEAPGKLMGLASYGVCDSKLSSHLEKLLSVPIDDDAGRFDDLRKTILGALSSIAEQVMVRDDIQAFDFSSLHPFAVGIAALTQKACQNVWTNVVADEIDQLENVFGTRFPKLHLTGGYSLNCPSNSQLQARLQSTSVVPLAGGSDMGLSIGAAKFAASLLFPVSAAAPGQTALTSAFPPRAPLHDESLEDHLSSVVPVKIQDNLTLAQWYAREVVSGQVFCHYEGDSEVGPRALGHRSIIASAALFSLRDKINRHKGRELWRPLAPIVRIEDFTIFFYPIGDIVETSSCMLYTFGVRQKNIVPAVTHVDGTARAQVVESGFLHSVLSEISVLGGVPVLINTSFNVAGEPLVETPSNAIRSFRKLRLDYLYLNGKVYV